MFSRKRVILHKHTCTSTSTGPSGPIVEPEPNDGLEPTIYLKTVHYKEATHLQTQVEQYTKVEHGDA